MKIPASILDNLHDLEQHPIEQASTIPSLWYYDKEMYDFEKEALFASNWQYIDHEDQLKESSESTIFRVF